MSREKKVPFVTFRTRECDEAIEGPTRWVDEISDEHFSGKRVILLSLPGAFTPTCSTYQLPDFERLYDEFEEEGIDAIYCVSANDAFVMNPPGKVCICGTSCASQTAPASSRARWACWVATNSASVALLALRRHYQ